MRQLITKAWQWLRRHPWWTALGGFLLALAGVLVGLDVWALGRFRAAEQALREEKYIQARAQLQQCQRVWWWQTADTYFLAARLERIMGNYPEAGKLLAKTRQLGGRTDEAAQLEALLLEAETGVSTQAEKSLWEKVESKVRDLPQILRTLATLSLRQGNYLKALEALNLCLELNPKSGEALERRGRVWEMLLSPYKAEKDYRQALAVAPHRSQARFFLVDLLLRTQGNPKEILDHVQYLLQEEPNRIEYQLAQGRIQILTGDFATARQTLDQVLQLEPQNTSVMMYRAELECQAGQFSVAEKWARKVLALKPFYNPCYPILAQSLQNQNDPKKQQEAAVFHEKYLVAKADDNRFFKLLKDSSQMDHYDPDIMAEIGEICLRAGAEETGISWLEKALARNPAHKAANSILEKYYLEKNQTKKKGGENKKLDGLSSPK